MGSTYLCFYGCSAHLISSHLISHHITSHHFISSHLTSHHITSHHITTHHVTVGEDGGRVSLPWLLQVHQSLSLTFIFLRMFHSCDLSLSCHHNLVSGSLFFHFLFFLFLFLFALPTLPLSCLYLSVCNSRPHFHLSPYVPKLDWLGPAIIV